VHAENILPMNDSKSKPITVAKIALLEPVDIEIAKKGTENSKLN